MENPMPVRQNHSDLLGFLALVNCKLILPFEELFRGELTTLQLLTLCALRRSGEISVTDLADRLYTCKQQMTRIISKLCDDGHIVRRRHPSDGRIVLVRLSEKTEGLMNERHARFAAAAGKVISKYDCEQDVGRFNDLIDELSRILAVLPGHAIELADTAE
ncbi:MAG: MarR family transcriptional regulator [Ruminococcaceae bacterium]|nr:MarR family transcriptional regulator [Oscillospiraceae bacterium]